MWCSSARQQQQVLSVSLMVDQDAVTPVRSVCDLGVYVDSDLSMRTHVARTVSECLAVLRQLRGIRRSVSVAVLQSLFHQEI
jgi:hypothetical protein